jgi:hypothetical protein
LEDDPRAIKRRYVKFPDENRCILPDHSRMSETAAATAPMRNGLLSPANGVGFASRAAPGAWQTPPPTWSIRSSRGVPAGHWVVSFPTALPTLFVALARLLSPVLQVIHRVIATFLIKQAVLKRSEADTGAVTPIQRFGSAANLNIHPHDLVLEGVYCTSSEGVPVFHEVPAPTIEQLQALLVKIIMGMMKILSRQGHLTRPYHRRAGHALPGRSRGGEPAHAPSHGILRLLALRWDPAPDKRCSACKPSPTDASSPHQHFATTRTASVCMRGCVVPPLNAGNSNARVGISPVQR